jgi:hypothetical protein
MGVMFEPRNSKRPLFGRIFQPLIDALRDTDMNIRLDFLPIDFIVHKCNHMVMEWSKLYSNKNNEHLQYEDFLALNEAAIKISVTEWVYLGRNKPAVNSPGKHFIEAQADDYNSKKQRVNPTTPTAGENAAAKGGGKYGKKKQQQTSSSAPKTKGRRHHRQQSRHRKYASRASCTESTRLHTPGIVLSLLAQENIMRSRTTASYQSPTKNPCAATSIK